MDTPTQTKVLELLRLAGIVPLQLQMLMTIGVMDHQGSLLTHRKSRAMEAGTLTLQSSQQDHLNGAETMMINQEEEAGDLQTKMVIAGVLQIKVLVAEERATKVEEAGVVLHEELVESAP